jgi:antitoxin VapB
MALSIRNPRVEELARDLAAKRKTTMTDVIEKALEKETKAEAEADTRPLYEQVKEIADRLKRKGKPGGHMMTKEEIDRMWGHE